MTMVGVQLVMGVSLVGDQLVVVAERLMVWVSEKLAELAWVQFWKSDDPQTEPPLNSSGLWRIFAAMKKTIYRYINNFLVRDTFFEKYI